MECIGRETDLAVLTDCVDSARSQALAVAVVGEPGIGVSTLVRSFLAAHPGTGLLAHGLEWERDTAGGVLSQVDAGDPAGSPAAAARQVVAALTAGQEEGPGVLVIDDAHHIDDLSLRTLVTAVRHHAEAPLLVVLCAPEVDERLRAAVDRTHHLRGLDAEAVSRLCRAHGRGIDSGTDDPLCALDGAVRAGLVDMAHGHHPRPAGAMVRPAVLQAMGMQEVAARHRAAAAVVTDEVRRLGHRVRAALLPDDALAREVDTLARVAAEAGSWDSASRLFRDAARLATDGEDRADRLVRSFDVLIAAGQVHAAEAMIPDIETLHETAERDTALAYLAIVRGRATEARARLRRAHHLVEAAGGSGSTPARIAQREVLDALARCRGDELVARADAAIDLAGADSSTGIEASAIRGLDSAASGDWDGAVANYRRLARTVEHGPQSQRITMGRGWLALAGERPDEARSLLETAVAMARLGGSDRITLWALGWLACVQYLTGDWDAALRTVETGRHIVDRSGVLLSRPLLEWTAVQVHAYRGDRTAAVAALRAADPGMSGYEIMEIPAALARAHLADLDAHPAEVLRSLDPLTRSRAQAVDEPGFWPWADVNAAALVEEGRHAEARTFFDAHEARAADRDRRSVLARLAGVRGRLRARTGDVDGAKESFERALELVAGLPLPVDEARLTFRYGQTLWRAGKRREAVDLLTRAREMWSGIGGTAVVDMCDRDVAARLYLSPKTIQFHLTRIDAKLGVRTRGELAALRAASVEGRDPADGRSPGEGVG